MQPYVKGGLMIKDQNIKYLFEPRSVAVIGASNDKGKIGNSVISNIIKSGYKNKILPINPKGGEIEGIKAFISGKRRFARHTSPLHHEKYTKIFNPITSLFISNTKCISSPPAYEMIVVFPSGLSLNI